MTRRYALIGAGKTGSKVPELLTDDEQCTIFNRANPPTLETLAGHDAIICFVPGPVLLDYLDTLLDSGQPVISGATGIDWPADLEQQLLERQVTWVWSHNFALGMTLVRQLIELLSSAPALFPDAQFRIHEVHHTAKLDAPSGTALSWQDWLGKSADITYERLDDVIGDHQLTLTTAHEEITISHTARDRKIFANGALWAARYLLDQPVPAGLLSIQQLTSMQTRGAAYANQG